MGRRRHQRFKKELTVTIHGTDSMGKPFSQEASVVDVSESGVRLQGVHVLYRPGQTAMLDYNGNKAQYRVAWVGAGALAGQAGLLNLQPSKSIFNLRLPPSGPDKYVVPPREVQEFEGRDFDESLRRLVEQRRRAEKSSKERRRFTRYAVRGDAELYTTGSQFPQRGKLTDLSRGGCFVELLPSVIMDTKVIVDMQVSHRRIRAQGVVKSVLTSFGLGIEFLHLAPEDLQRLDEVLAALEQGAELAPLPDAMPMPAPARAVITTADPQHALEAVKSWFGDHDLLTRQEFLALLKKAGVGER